MPWCQGKRGCPNWTDDREVPLCRECSKTRIADLEAIVAKLPVTADGVPYIPCLDKRTFYAIYRCYRGGEPGPWKVASCKQHCRDDTSDIHEWDVDNEENCECEVLTVCSTREAAEKAKEEKEQTHGNY